MLRGYNYHPIMLVVPPTRLFGHLVVATLMLVWQIGDTYDLSNIIIL